MDIAVLGLSWGASARLTHDVFLRSSKNRREGVTPPETSSRSRNRDAAIHRIKPRWVKSCTHLKRDMLRELGIDRVVTSSSTELSHHHQPGCHIMLQMYPGAWRLPGSTTWTAYAVTFGMVC